MVTPPGLTAVPGLPSGSVAVYCSLATLTQEALQKLLEDPAIRTMGADCRGLSVLRRPRGPHPSVRWAPGRAMQAQQMLVALSERGQTLWEPSLLPHAGQNMWYRGSSCPGTCKMPNDPHLSPLLQTGQLGGALVQKPARLSISLGQKPQD